MACQIRSCSAMNARREADLGDVARARQVDDVLADRVRGGAGGKDHDAVGEADGLLEVVGDEDDALPVGAPELEQLVLHERARLHVERRERLVHEEDLRVEDEHLRERDALSHAARELVGVAVAEAGEAHAREPVLALRAGGGPVLAAELEARRHVVEGAAPGHQRLGLEHVAGAAVHARERLAEDPRVARRGPEQSRRDVEERGLAAARRARPPRRTRPRRSRGPRPSRPCSSRRPSRRRCR